MRLTEETRETLEKALKGIAQLRDAGVMPDSAYYKSIVSLAYEFAVGEDMPRAVSLLQNIPHEYFENEHIEQMTADPDFMVVCFTLAMRLVDAGYVDITAGVKTNQPPAMA